MEIIKTLNGKELNIAIKGELNSTNYGELDQMIGEVVPTIESLIFDLAELSYISSAGLRVLLVAKKLIDKQNGKMLIKNANEDVMDIFNMTGFTNILDFE